MRARRLETASDLRDAETRRVRHLITLDARNVVARLERRLVEMVGLFSRLRDRAPLLEAVKSWFPGVSFGQLALLEPEEQRAVDAFYRVVEDLRWYLEYTEDMPLQLERTIGLLFRGIVESHASLVGVVGRPEDDGKRPRRRGKRRHSR